MDQSTNYQPSGRTRACNLSALGSTFALSETFVLSGPFALDSSMLAALLTGPSLLAQASLATVADSPTAVPSLAAELRTLACNRYPTLGNPLGNPLSKTVLTDY